MFAAVGIAIAVASLAPVTDAEIEALCRQLGDPAYRARDAATRKLRACGAPAHAKVLEHCTDADPEIALRCRNLLPALRFDAIVADQTGSFCRELPGYERYRKVVGWSDPARLLFARLDSQTYFLRTGPAIEELAPWQRGAADGSVYQPKPIEVARYLFETEPHPEHDMQFLDCGWLDPMLANAPEGTLLRKLLAARLSGHLPNGYLGRTISPHIERMELKEILPYAIDQASNSSLNAAARAQCLTLIARIGSRDELPALEKFLDDRTLVTDVNRGPSRTQRTLLCDVALVSCARLAGIPLDEIGMPEMKLDLGLRRIHLYGFETEDARTEARARLKRAIESKK